MCLHSENLKVPFLLVLMCLTVQLCLHVSAFISLTVQLFLIELRFVEQLVFNGVASRQHSNAKSVNLDFDSAPKDFDLLS